MTPPDRSFRTGERGAAVLLFVALVVAVAIAAAAAMIARQPQFAVERAANTGFDLGALRKAVEAHAATVNGGAVACPDYDNDGDDGLDPDNAEVAPSCPTPAPPNVSWFGRVPWKTIGVTERQVRDAWGQYVFLIVTGSSLELVTPQLGSQTGCDFILVSAGANGAWDFTTSPGGGDPTKITLRGQADGIEPADVDIAMCGGLGSDDTPPQAPLDIITADGAQHIARRMKTPPHPDWATADQVHYFGGSSDDPDTYDLTDPSVSKTSCAWTTLTYPFVTEVVRGYMRFQLLPGETLATQTEGTNQGFALMFVPGTRMAEDTPTAVCGTAGNDNAYGFKGVLRPKFAIEFDIFRDYYEGMDDYSNGGRNNPRPEGNHVAVLNPSTIDYISHGVGGNPKCQAWGTFGTGPATNGDPGACTYPPGDATDYTPSGADPRPARHADRPANWLEDKPYTDTALSRRAAQPYQVRFELRRNCTPGCSVCGTEAANAIYMQVKAWVACDPILDGNTNGCPVLPPEFERLDSLYDGETEYMVNYCMGDRSLKSGQVPQSYSGGPTPPETFDTVRVGVGFSSRNSAVALLLHRFEVMSEDPPDE